MLDLVVVGGGPVGLATAIEGTLRGLAVAVLEPRPDPVDKACGEGLMPGGTTRMRPRSSMLARKSKSQDWSASSLTSSKIVGVSGKKRERLRAIAATARVWPDFT